MTQPKRENIRFLTKSRILPIVIEFAKATHMHNP